MLGSADPNVNDDNAATAVDVGNYLGFIVGPFEETTIPMPGGDNNVDPRLGVKMPNPQRGVNAIDISVCWEPLTYLCPG